MYWEKQKQGPVFVTRAEALLRYAQEKRNKNKGGGAVFYVNDELGCEEIKNSIDETEYLGFGITLGKSGRRLCLEACWESTSAVQEWS